MNNRSGPLTPLIRRKPDESPILPIVRYWLVASALMIGTLSILAWWMGRRLVEREWVYVGIATLVITFVVYVGSYIALGTYHGALGFRRSRVVSILFVAISGMTLLAAVSIWSFLNQGSIPFAYLVYLGIGFPGLLLAMIIRFGPNMIQSIDSNVPAPTSSERS